MDKEQQAFHKELWEYYETSGRHDLPWRQPEPDGTFDAYKIMVSEIMLQQTQVSRVIPKYQNFITEFPTIASLARASLAEVLRQWQGLGYNRRAKFLWQAAVKVTNDYNGALPHEISELITLPGVGKNTAGAIVVYAYNHPAIFIETNIRTVYIHHFFADKKDIDDKELLPLLSKTIDTDQPRLFYWALMDYGTHLKQALGNLNKLSKSYVKQGSFHGSKRQIRGAVIRALTVRSHSYEELQAAILDERLDSVLMDLVAESLITKNGTHYRL